LVLSFPTLSGSQRPDTLGLNQCQIQQHQRIRGK
jgi:hypothetical protein